MVHLKKSKKFSASSQRWLKRQLTDPYVQKAKDMGFRSRAAFKLLDINAKFHILRPGMTVVDLGAAPGGWSQVAAKVVGPEGLVYAVDIQEIEPLPSVIFQQMDCRDEAQVTALLDNIAAARQAPPGTRCVDVVLSDMAAAACGQPKVDHLRIIALAEMALYVAETLLKPRGMFVAKLLQGGAQGELQTHLKRLFTHVKYFKPASSRRDSAEIYLVATGFKTP